MYDAMNWLKACLFLVMTLGFLIFIVLVVWISITDPNAHYRYNEKDWRADCSTSTWVTGWGFSRDVIDPMTDEDIALYC